MSAGDAAWADLILVMERKYAARLRALLGDVALPPIETLDIPDDYPFMDPELVELLSTDVEEKIREIRKKLPALPASASIPPSPFPADE